MWTHNKDGVTREFLKRCHQEVARLNKINFSPSIPHNPLVAPFKNSLNFSPSFPRNPLAAPFKNSLNFLPSIPHNPLVAPFRNSLNFPPSIPCNPLVALFKNSLVTPSLSCVHIHSFSSDWERQLWLSKYFDQVSVCLCVPFLWRSLQFLVRVFPFLSLILCLTKKSLPKNFIYIYVKIIITFLFFTAPPPSYDSLFGRVREAHKASKGMFDFLKNVIILLLGTSMFF